MSERRRRLNPSHLPGNGGKAKASWPEADDAVVRAA